MHKLSHHSTLFAHQCCVHTTSLHCLWQQVVSKPTFSFHSIEYPFSLQERNGWQIWVNHVEDCLNWKRHVILMKWQSTSIEAKTYLIMDVNGLQYRESPLHYEPRPWTKLWRSNMGHKWTLIVHSSRLGRWLSGAMQQAPERSTRRLMKPNCMPS